MTSRWPSFVALAVVGGCGFIGYDERPPCQGSACTSREPATGTDAGGGGDASGNGGGSRDAGGDGGGDGDGQSAPCGSIQLLREDFDDGQVQNGWVERYRGGAAVALTNGRLELAPGSADGSEATYRSSQAWDLRGGALVVTLKAGAGAVGVAVREGALERVDPPISPLRGGVSAVVEGGRLSARVLDGESENERASVPYDAEAQRHLRLREAAGRILWESSPDRNTWTAFHEEAAPIDAWVVRVELFARGPGDVSWFDDLGGEGEGATYCPPARLADEFGDGALSPGWRRWFGAGTCTVEERDGRLELALSGQAFAMCGLVSSGTLDMRNASVSFALAPPEASTNSAAFADFTTYGQGNDTGTERMELRVVDGAVKMRVTHKPGPMDSEIAAFEASVPYDAESMRWFRMGERAGTFTWASSPDGVTWREDASADVVYVDPARVLFGLNGVKTAGSGDVSFRYDDVGE